MMTENNLIVTSMNDDQANLIDWFSQLLIRPLEEQMITTYRSEPMLQFIANFGEEFECQEITNSIHRQLTEGDIKQVQNHLNWSYTLLFEGVSGPRSISLYESGYFGDGSRLFQQPFLDMQTVLQDLDVSAGVDCKEPADHISLELAAFAEAIRQNNAEMAIALHQRLMRWVPQLTTDVGQMQFGSFYHNILFLLDAYLTSFYHQSPEHSGTSSLRELNN